LGTKHGYTEKKCKVCHEVKPRSDFPAYGGLTCRACTRDKERAERPARYQRDKQNPKYVEENRRRARDYKRRKKAEREEQNVTEPPEDSYEEYEKAWDNAGIDEVMDGLEDDALIDSIAQGATTDEAPNGLARALAELRDAVDATNIPVKNTAKVERGENVLPPRNEGTAQDMSAQEEAARLRSIAGDTSALGAVQQLLQVLEDAQANVTNALGEGHSRAGDALGPFQTAIQQAQELQGVVHAAYENLNGIAGQIG
jgi:hypothetical protein